MKLKDLKNAFWCCERMLAELLPHYNMPEMVYLAFFIIIIFTYIPSAR